MLYDLIIIGGGPAGLSTAISGASELRHVLLIDSGRKIGPDTYERQLGGQAIGSAAIENYAGFPDPITGCELMARMEKQAVRLGTEIRCPEHASGIELLPNGTKNVLTREGGVYNGKAVVIASGLSYTRHRAVGIEDLLGHGVQYGAPTSNPSLLGKCRIGIVGGANSAGQAALNLARNTDAEIKMLIRGAKTLEDQMSMYLIDRIRSCTNIEVLQGYSVVEVWGNGQLETAVLEKTGGERFEFPLNHLFIFIGAQPKVDWLPREVERDAKGFIGTGAVLSKMHGERLPHETSMPGVFAAGDVRLDAVRRVASGVGEGSSTIKNVHQYLAVTQFDK